MALLEHRLSNGLQVVADHNDGSQLFSVGYFVRAGSRDESLEVSGVSHFLEHMCFKGTPTRSALDINTQLDELGANANARTSEESTVYHATVLPDFQSDMVELLTDMMRPSLLEEDFETEKQVILEEIAMYRDQPPYGGHELIMENYFRSHALSRSVLGTEDSVTGLTASAMRQYHRNHYAASNLILAVAGRVDFDLLIEDLEKFTASWEKLPTPQRTVDSYPGAVNQSCLVVPQSHQQYVLQLSPAPSCTDDDRYAFRLAASILGDDTGSRLFWELIDPGLADMAVTGVYEYEGCGVMLSIMACRPEDRESIWERFETIERRFLEEGPTDRELDLAKAKVISSMSLASEISENRMFDLGGQWLTYGSFTPLEEIARQYQEVRREDISRVLEKYPVLKKTVLWVGPENRE